MTLADHNCEPCRGGIPALSPAEVAPLVAELDGWTAVAVHHIEKEYKFRDFAAALAFVNEVGAIAEAEDHHPDIWFTWGRAKIEIRTHKIDGLTRNDFILAAKIDRVGATTE
ncbi:MAG: 4a-hydroxytetrahydrobiopterin dehydratase [Planctomycetota bacterium]